MPIDEETRKEYATKAANAHCRCFKCDGIRNDTHQKCGPKPCNTCPEWYAAYWGARLALEMFGNAKIPSNTEPDDNHPRIQYLKAQIKSLDDELENTKQDRDKWKDESNRWFERYTGSEVFKKLAIAEDENRRLKDTAHGLEICNSKLQEQVALLQAEFKKDPGDAKG